MVIGPCFPSRRRAIGTEDIGGDFEEVNQPGSEVLEENFSQIFETDVYIVVSSNGIQ